MDLIDFVKLGGKISLNTKMGLEDWYGAISLSFLDNEPFFSGFNYRDYRKNLTIEEAVYVLLAEYKHWKNYAYLIERLQSKNELSQSLEDYDFESPSKELVSIFNKEKKLAKQDWNKEFSQEKIESLKKPVIKDVEKKLEELLKGKEYHEYCDILNDYSTQLFNLGVDYRIYFYFERGKNGCYGVELKNKEYSKNQINGLIENQFDSITYESITISVYIDEKRYTYNESLYQKEK